MDFEQAPLPHPASNPPPPADKPRKRSGWKVFWSIFTSLSVIANIIMTLMLFGTLALVFAGQKGLFTEEVIQEGPRTDKIAVITVKGIIDDTASQDVYKQLKSAKKDKHVKGLIVLINTPGGMVSSSDQIYNEICKYRFQTKQPVIAFMQGMATSGGYYTAVACDKIIAEPTVITGSIGVIMGHFVIQNLLEEKLGIQPVIIKSGDKKDWPSPFAQPTDEQKQYLQDKLINPAYERFVELVAKGRPSLTPEQVRYLADGSIYSAQEAVKEQLVDKIGYMDDAIEEVKTMAVIPEAEVIEYSKPFSMTSLFGYGSEGMLNISASKLYELSTPKAMYLWSAYR